MWEHDYLFPRLCPPYPQDTTFFSDFPQQYVLAGAAVSVPLNLQGREKEGPEWLSFFLSSSLSPFLKTISLVFTFHVLQRHQRILPLAPCSLT